MSKSKNKIAGKAVSYLVLIIGAVVMLVPFIWMVLTSFKTYAEAVKVPVVWLPAVWKFDNYREVLLRLDFLQYYGNTILVTFLVTVIMLFIGSLSAFAFARMEFPFKNFLFFYAPYRIYGSGSDDDDSQVSDYKQTSLGGYLMGISST